MNGMYVAQIARTYGRSERAMRTVLDRGQIPYTRDTTRRRIVAHGDIPALVAATPRPGQTTTRVIRRAPTFEDVAWMLRGACNDADPLLFHPDTACASITRAAKAICGTCPVIGTCREWALTRDERHGTWGGLSEYDRRQLKSSRKATAA